MSKNKRRANMMQKRQPGQSPAWSEPKGPKPKQYSPFQEDTQQIVDKLTQPVGQAVEGYKLMQYQCERCGVIEVVWNSRGNVTPFIIHCQCCVGEMRHINWSQDIYAPNHIPEPGQRVFIDMPDSLRLPLARMRVKAGDGTPYELQGEERERIIQQIAQDFPPESPWLIVWPGGQHG